MSWSQALGLVLGVVATGLADFRWWRVAQREHYLAGSVTRFALRWWTLGPNVVLGIAAVIGVAASPVSPFPEMVAAAAIAIGPFRYPLVGTAPGPVAWTARLRAVAAVTAAVQVVVVVLSALVGAGVAGAGVMALIAPLVVDGALAALRPWEDRKARVFVDMAANRLGEVRPTVVGITGSYGKTTTKVYAAHLIRGARTVVASPASFNNRAGLSRAINEQLVPGTDVFIAEMGTYGRGEIAELCRWCPPKVAAITAIGPVHLERFGSEAAIIEAKSEIFGPADVAIVNADDPRLAALRPGPPVTQCSTTDAGADVCARVVDEQLVVLRAGEQIASVPDRGASPSNVAVAVAIALAVDVPVEMIASSLGDLPPVANRRAEVTLSTGAAAIDDTFNSNPAGARAALDALARRATPGAKRIVVTPGMVELGPRQAVENTLFGEAAAREATHVIVVGFTNRRALLEGIQRVPVEERAAMLVADTHDRAVEWVREHTAAGDVVLYENQLPDHYP